MISLNSLTIQAVAATGLQNVFAPPAESRLTTLLLHRFAFGGESWKTARDRLRRQLEWVRDAFTPMTLSQVETAFAHSSFPRRPILVTVDDAYTDMLEVAEDFRAFEVPAALFVCAGWSAQASEPEPDGRLARVVASIEWYRGAEISLALGQGAVQLRLSPDRRAQVIDALLSPQGDLSACVAELAERLDELLPRPTTRTICNWDELRQLQAMGIEMGCHSVSHIRLASASRARVAFEVGESKRLLESQLGNCSVFAYPYGTADAHNDASTQAIAEAGFKLAFLTHSDFSSTQTDRYRLPRITLPDREMSHAEYRARVDGGSIPIRKAKAMLRGLRAHVR